MPANSIFWVRFATRQPGTVFAESEQDAIAKGAKITGCKATYAAPLPYPAEPIINAADNTHGTPSFCFEPEQCAGRTSCPRRHACCE